MSKANKYYESHPWGRVCPQEPPTIEALADRDLRLADSDPVRILLGDPPQGYRRTELRRSSVPTVNQTLGRAIIAVSKPCSTGRVADWMSISLPAVNF